MEICKYYRHKKKCKFNGECAEQLASDKTVCCSDLYYAMGLEKIVLQLRKLNVKRRKAIKKLQRDIELRKIENKTLKKQMFEYKAKLLLDKDN